MPSADKRRWARKSIRLTATYSYYAGTFVTSTGQTVTLDLSERGALIQMPNRIPVNEVVKLTLHAEADHPIILESRVVHVGTPQNGVYPIGVSFRNLTPDDEYVLNRQMQKDISIAGRERRQAPRKPISISARYSYYAKTFVTLMGETVTLNLSKRGALIQLAEPVPIGEAIMLTLNLERGNPIVLDTHVAHVKATTSKKFAVGVAFNNLSPNDEYLLGLQLQKSVLDAP